MIVVASYWFLRNAVGSQAPQTVDLCTSSHGSETLKSFFVSKLSLCQVVEIMYTEISTPDKGKALKSSELSYLLFINLKVSY